MVRDTGATENPKVGDIQESWFKRNKSWLIITGVLLILLIAIFVWKYIEGRNYEKQLVEQQELYQSKINTTVHQESKAFLSKIMKPLTWAVRTEMLKDNMDQVNDYMEQFVKEEHIELIMVIDADGDIVASTDLKRVGQRYSDEYSEALLSVNGITVKDYENESIIAAAPIMGYNSKLGTLIMVYKPSVYYIQD